MPTFNEEAGLAGVLPAALAAGADELVISDGGSSDSTAELARRLGARVVEGPAGRGRQLNRGAAACRAPVLLFLHADTLLPPAAVERVRRAVASGAVGGGFLMRFAEDRPILRLSARVVNWRTRWNRLPLGDQAQFASREAFERLGGFAEWPIFEDLDFARRLRRRGPMAILSPPVVTSARRFLEQGAARTIATNWLIRALFTLGASPHALASLYRPDGGRRGQKHESPGARVGAPGPRASGRDRRRASG